MFAQPENRRHNSWGRIDSKTAGTEGCALSLYPGWDHVRIELLKGSDCCGLFPKDVFRLQQSVSVLLF